MTPRPRNTRGSGSRLGAVWPPMAMLLLLAVLVGGCSPGSTGGGQTAATPTPSPTATNPCADVAALEASINSLGQVDVAQVGTEGLKTAVQDVRAKLKALADSAGSQLGPELAHFQSVLGALGSTLSGVTDTSSLKAALPAIRQNLTEVRTTGQTLVAQTKSTFSCP